MEENIKPPETPIRAPTPTPAMPPAYAPKKKMKKAPVIAISLSIIVVVLLGMALFMPWWNLGTDLDGDVSGEMMGSPVDFTMDMEMGIEFGLYEAKNTTEMHTEGTMAGEPVKVDQSDSNRVKYSDKEEVKNAEITEIVEVFNLTSYLTIAALIVGIIALLSSILVCIGKLSHKVGIVVFVVALILLVTTPTYIAVTLPDEANELMQKSQEEENYTANMTKLEVDNFWGSDTSDMSGEYMGMSMDVEAKAEWGPTYGWYLTVIALILTIVGIVFIAKSGTPKQKVEYQPPASPQTPQPPQA